MLRPTVALMHRHTEVVSYSRKTKLREIGGKGMDGKVEGKPRVE